MPAGTPMSLASHGTSDELSFNEGDKFCVLTNQGRVVLLVTLPEIPTGWEFEVTVWKQCL